MSDAPSQNYQLIRKFIPPRLQPLFRGLRKRYTRWRLNRPSWLPEPYYSVFPYTHASMTRQRNLVNLVQDIERRNIPGAIVECGVLDGGTAALMAHTSMASGRPVHLFDSWEGLPNPTGQDGAGGNAWAGEDVGSPGRVRRVMRRLGVPDNRVTLHKGWFNETLAKAPVDQVALVHVDADFYDSVKLCIEHWYPRLSPGGYMQFDDYDSFVGCTRAVDEFLQRNPELKMQIVQEFTSAYFVQKPLSA